MAIWGTSPSDLWVFTEDKYAHHFDGSHWTDILRPGTGYSASGTATNDMWFGGDKGFVLSYKP